MRGEREREKEREREVHDKESDWTGNKKFLQKIQTIKANEI